MDCTCIHILCMYATCMYLYLCMYYALCYVCMMHDACMQYYAIMRVPVPLMHYAFLYACMYIPIYHANANAKRRGRGRLGLFLRPLLLIQAYLMTPLIGSLSKTQPIEVPCFWSFEEKEAEPSLENPDKANTTLHRFPLLYILYLHTYIVLYCVLAPPLTVVSRSESSWVLFSSAQIHSFICWYIHA